jgi:hypothetical protein
MSELASAADASGARAVIYTMGFEQETVQQALAQAHGNEQLAINLILNGGVRNAATVSSALPISMTMSGSDHVVAILADYCEKPPVVNATASHCTISCFWAPSEIDFEHELGFSCRIEKRGGSDVITAVDFSTSSQATKVVDFLAILHERVSLPFYILSPDHARLFVKRTIWQDMDVEGWVEPSTWSCPMIMNDLRSSSGASFAISSPDSVLQFSDQRYSKFMEWLDAPPTFPGSLTRGCHAQFASRIAFQVFLSDVKVIESLLQLDPKFI